MLGAAIAGFAPYKSAADDSSRAGLTLTIDIKLQVAGVATTVTVGGEAPIVDTTTPEQRFNVSGDFMNALPLSSHQNWDSVWFMVPGGYTMGRTGPDLNIDPQIHGASSRSNIYKLDGMEIGSSYTNQGWVTQFSTEAIQDISIKTSGLDASTPLGEGAYANVITKSGGNQFHGSAAFYIQPWSFNWNNVPGGIPATQKLYQPDLSLGGPIIKDKTWFFITYRYVDTTTAIARTPAVIQTFVTNNFPTPQLQSVGWSAGSLGITTK